MATQKNREAMFAPAFLDELGELPMVRAVVALEASFVFGARERSGECRTTFGGRPPNQAVRRAPRGAAFDGERVDVAFRSIQIADVTARVRYEEVRSFVGSVLEELVGVKIGVGTERTSRRGEPSERHRIEHEAGVRDLDHDRR
jgi:hypothetical protein